MLIRICNASQKPVSIPGSAVSVGPGETKTSSGRTVADAVSAARLSGPSVVVMTEIEPTDRVPMAMVFGAIGAPGAGVKTVVVTSSLIAAASAYLGTNNTGVGGALAEQNEFGLAVFNDAACTQPATGVKLHTATVGTFLTGEQGWNATLRTSAAGALSLTMEIPTAAARTVHVKAYPILATQRVFDVKTGVSVTFSP